LSIYACENLSVAISSLFCRPQQSFEKLVAGNRYFS